MDHQTIPKTPTKSDQVGKPWECLECTYINAYSPQCQMCTAKNPFYDPTAETRPNPKLHDDKDTFLCAFCSTVNSFTAQKCTGCSFYFFLDPDSMHPLTGKDTSKTTSQHSTAKKTEGSVDSIEQKSSEVGKVGVKTQEKINKVKMPVYDPTTQEFSKISTLADFINGDVTEVQKKVVPKPRVQQEEDDVDLLGGLFDDEPAPKIPLKKVEKMIVKTEAPVRKQSESLELDLLFQQPIVQPTKKVEEPKKQDKIQEPKKSTEVKKDDKKPIGITLTKPKAGEVKPTAPTAAKVGLTVPTSKAPIVKKPQPRKPVLKKPQPAGKDKKVPVSTKPPVPKAPVSKAPTKPTEAYKDPSQLDCPHCSFKNPITDIVCNGCYKHMYMKDEPKVDLPQGCCKYCTFQNPPEAVRCEVCNNDLKMSKFMVSCPKCTMENHRTCTKCIGCDGRLPETEHNKLMYNICDICNSVLDIDVFDRHVVDCKEALKIMQDMKEKEMIQQLKQSCPYCKEVLIKAQFQHHISVCPMHTLYFSQEKVFGTLTPLQKDVVKFMQQNSCKLHFSAKLPFLKRLEKLGHNEKDLQRLYIYMSEEVPLIVHIHINKHMEFFVKDTNYRNQFETGKSSGSTNLPSRMSWQTRMFFKKYDKADKFEKVKYGTVNFTNDPKGVSACRSYGNSYLLLKPQMRERCTVTDQDSSNASSLIGTFKFCYHILNRLTDAELKATIRASRGQQVPSNVVGTYKEIQIHGPIQFSRDIAKLYVNKNEYNTPALQKLVQTFVDKFKVPFEVFTP